MAMIPDSIVDEVRERADLAEVVGQVVDLKRAGREFKALCPFHQEKTPSFYVVPDKGFYKCFGCGAAGDVFDFLMNQGGLSFPEAVRRMADRVGVVVPEQTPEREDDPYRKLYEAVAFAADFFERQLQESEGAERARQYLERRGVDATAARRFRLGYAPGGGQALRDAAKKHGIEDEVLLSAGLVKESEKRDEPFDRLRNRVVFPITDLRGRVIAFGGRVLDENDKPKYLNSPETPVYQKGRTLYGLAWAKHAIRRDAAVLVVEGYMDFVSLSARGIENVIAPLGTAMTEEQATLLSRYARRALLLYDSDAAGQRATFRTADALLRAGVHPLVVTLPEKQDPDSVAREHGAEGLQKYLKEAQDVLERKLALLEERGYFVDIDGTRRALDGLLPTIRATMDPQLRDLYIDRVVRKTGVRRETLERELKERPRAVLAREASGAAAAAGRSVEAGPGAPAVARAEGPPAGDARGQPPAPTSTSERLMLLVLLRDTSRIDTVRAALAPEALRDPVYREIYRLMLEHGMDEAAVNRLSEPARRRLEQMRLDPVDLSPADRVLGESLLSIQLEDIGARLEELDERIAFAPDEERPQLMREGIALRAQARSLGIRWRETPLWKGRAASAGGGKTTRRGT